MKPPEKEILPQRSLGEVMTAHKEKGISLLGKDDGATHPQKESGAAQGFVCPGRGRQDTELSAKEGPSQVGQPGDDDSLQGQRRRAWTP